MQIAPETHRDTTSTSGGIRSFKDLDAWKLGHELVLDVYKHTKAFPKDEFFGLTNQMRRAAVSVTSNIAEGYGRNTAKDKAHFYVISKGSLLEIQNQLQVAHDLGYVSSETFDALDKKLERAVRVTYGLIRSASWA